MRMLGIDCVAMVKSCDSAPCHAMAMPAPQARRARALRSSRGRERVEQRAGSIMDKKAQGSGSGKALGIGKLLASACRGAVAYRS